MIEHTVKIDGMNCGHCILAVRRELAKIPGLVVRDVTIGSASVLFPPELVTQAQIDAAVAEAGYLVVR